MVSLDQLFVKRTVFSYLEEQLHSWTNCVSRPMYGFFLFSGEMSEISSSRSMHMSLSLSTLKVVSLRFGTSSQMLRSKDTIGWMLNSHICHHICTHSRKITLSFSGNFVLVGTLHVHF